MAELTDFIGSLEKDLTCSICDDIFTEPKQLQCLHSFCQKCVLHWSETCRSRGNALTCPTCRSQEDGDVKKLRSSFYLDSLKQLLFAMKNKASKSEVKLLQPDCVSCQEHVELVAFCPECEGVVCGECANAHKQMKKLRDEHHVAVFNELRQEHVNSYISNQFHCQEKFHDKHKLEYYCETCCKSICQMCSNTAHTTHAKISVGEKFEEIRQIMNIDMDRINLLKETYKQELEMSKQNIGRIENEIAIAKKVVSAHVQAQIKILQDCENSTAEILEEKFLKQKAINDEEQKEINSDIQQLESFAATFKDQKLLHCILQNQLPQKIARELVKKESVLKSKPNKRNASLIYKPGIPVTQSSLGEVVESLPDPSQCSVELQVHYIQCCSTSKFSIITRNAESDLCHTNVSLIDVQIKDSDGLEVKNEVTEYEEGRYTCTATYQKVSTYTILVTIGGKEIKNSPLSIKVFNVKLNFKPVEIFADLHHKRSHPKSLGVSDNGQVAIIEEKNVVVYESDGTFLREYDPKNKRLVEDVSYCGAVIHKDKVFIGENDDCIYLCKMREFNIDGTYLRTIFKRDNITLHCICNAAQNIAVCCNNGFKRTSNMKKKTRIWLLDKQSGQCVQEIILGIFSKEFYENPAFICYGKSQYFLSCINYISVHDENGNLLYQLGTWDTNGGQFFGLAVYDDFILVCDSHNHCVHVLTLDGQLFTSFGSEGAGLGQMEHPVDIDITPDGKLLWDKPNFTLNTCGTE